MFYSFVIRSEPVQSFQWGTDSVISVRFNPGEPDILAASARYVLYTFICYMITCARPSTAFSNTVRGFLFFQRPQHNHIWSPHVFCGKENYYDGIVETSSLILVIWNHFYSSNLKIANVVCELLFFRQTKTNSIAWNPMEPMNLTAVSENHILKFSLMGYAKSAFVFCLCANFIPWWNWIG